MDHCHAPFWLIVVLVVYVSIVAFGKQCEPLRGSFRKQCALAGYNQTFPIPYEMNPEVKISIAGFISETLKLMKNCSVGAMAETLVCSFIFAPRCIEGRRQPQLPCRRVCSEYINRCVSPKYDDTFLQSYLGHMYGLCTMLPNSTSSSGECYEPPGFEKHYNSSSTAFMQETCHKNIIPWCQNANFTYTILPSILQRHIYKLYYDKNFTGDPANDSKFSNNTFMHHIELLINRFPKCAKKIKMVLCAEIISPCFPGERVTKYTACQSVCFSIYKTCPEIKDTFLHQFFEECMYTTPGNSSHGFCALKAWPNPHEWLHQKKYFGIFPTTKPPDTSTAVGAGVIVAAVLVPIIVIGLVIAFVFLWRNRKLPWRYFDMKAEDRKDLVT